jgi:hypothetical protein
MDTSQQRVCKDGVCLFATSASGKDRPLKSEDSHESSLSKSPPVKSEKDERDTYLDKIIKKASANPQQRKTQKKYHRASSDCDSSEEDDEPPVHGSNASTTLTREQALKLSLRKKIDERRRHH